MNTFIKLILRNRLPLLVFATVIFITGICFGALAVRTVSYERQQNLFRYFNEFMDNYQEIEYEKTSFVRNSIKFNLLNIIIIWLLGTTVVLVFVIPILVFFKGFVLGFTVGFLLGQFQFRGVLIAAGTVFPQNILLIPSLIMAAALGIGFTMDIIKSYRGKIRLTFENFIDYSLRMGIFTIFLLGGALIEVYLSPVLFSLIIKYFH